jgi:AcrR family transcriptional regulator
MVDSFVNMTKMSIPYRVKDAMPSTKRSTRRAPSSNRVAVDEERKALTRSKILAAAIRVVAEKGVITAVIDDFIRAAGVARGTFYNYFRSTDEVLEAAAQWLEDDLIVSIDDVMRPIEDPVERFTLGMRLWLRKARGDRAWCAFVARFRYHGSLVEEALARDVGGALRTGQLSISNTAVGRDLIVGTIREAMGRMSDTTVTLSYLDDIVRTILRALGVDEARIGVLVDKPVPAMPRKPRVVG